MRCEILLLPEALLAKTQFISFCECIFSQQLSRHKVIYPTQLFNHLTDTTGGTSREKRGCLLVHCAPNPSPCHLSKWPEPQVL